MIDIHSHVIYEADDGSSTMDESIKMIQEAEKAGVRTIIATPHFHKEIFETERIVEKYHELGHKASKYDVSILLGYEVFINPVIPEILTTKSRLTLGGSRYMLVELPFDAVPPYSFGTICKLQLKNITPVIAHPERNRSFLKCFDLFLAFIEMGCLMQVDSASVLGVYGRAVKSFAKKIIKLNMAHFAASNAHYPEDYAERYMKAYNSIRRWAGEEQAEKLFLKNPISIINNEKESIYKLI